MLHHPDSLEVSGGVRSNTILDLDHRCVCGHTRRDNISTLLLDPTLFAALPPVYLPRIQCNPYSTEVTMVEVLENQLSGTKEVLKK